MFFSWVHYLASAPLGWLDFGLQCVDLGRKIRAEKLQMTRLHMVKFLYMMAQDSMRVKREILREFVG